MKQSINNSQFHNAFHSMGRGDQFSYEALDLIFDYIESLESDTGEEYELDVIAICCEFAESTVDEVISNYSLDISECNDESDKHALVSDYLEYNTILLGESNNESYTYIQF